MTSGRAENVLLAEDYTTYLELEQVKGLIGKFVKNKGESSDGSSSKIAEFQQLETTNPILQYQEGKEFYPILIGNHYVLLKANKKEEGGGGVNFELYDSLPRAQDQPRLPNFKYITVNRIGEYDKYKEKNGKLIKLDNQGKEETINDLTVTTVKNVAIPEKYCRQTDGTNCGYAMVVNLMISLEMQQVIKGYKFQDKPKRDIPADYIDDQGNITNKGEKEGLELDDTLSDVTKTHVFLSKLKPFIVQQIQDRISEMEASIPKEGSSSAAATSNPTQESEIKGEERKKRIEELTVQQMGTIDKYLCTIESKEGDKTKIKTQKEFIEDLITQVKSVINAASEEQDKQEIKTQCIKYLKNSISDFTRARDLYELKLGGKSKGGFLKDVKNKEYVGIGIKIGINAEGKFYVMEEPQEGVPARDKFHTGDIITSINGTELSKIEGNTPEEKLFALKEMLILNDGDLTIKKQGDEKKVVFKQSELRILKAEENDGPIKPVEVEELLEKKEAGKGQGVAKATGQGAGAAEVVPVEGNGDQGHTLELVAKGQGEGASKAVSAAAAAAAGRGQPGKGVGRAH